MLVAAYLKAPNFINPQQNTLFDMFVAESSSISIPWMTDETMKLSHWHFQGVRLRSNLSSKAFDEIQQREIPSY